MSVRLNDPDGQSPPGDRRNPLLSTRALLLLVLAIGAGLVCFFHPAVGVALLVGIAVLTLLQAVVGD